MKNTTRRVFTAALMCAFLFSAAYVFASGKAEKQAGGSSGKPYAGKTIRFIGESVPPTNALVELIPEFEAATGIKVETEIYPYNTVVQKEMLDVTSQQGYYDAMSMPYEHLGKFVENGYITPIDKWLNDPAFTPPSFQRDDLIAAMEDASALWKGKYYGFPSNSCTMFFIYRKDLFAHQGEQKAFKAKYGYDLQVPRDWDAYRDAAEFFTRRAGQQLMGQKREQDFFGVAIAGKRHPALTCEWLNYAWSFGGGVFDKNGEKAANLIINSPENIASLEYFVDLFQFAPPGATNYTWDEVAIAFQQDKVGMAVEWNDCSIGIEDPANSKVVGKMGYGTLPVHKKVGRKVSHFGAWTYVINSFSKNQDAAYTFIAWAVSPDIQLKWAQKGGVPCRLSTYDSMSGDFWAGTKEALTQAVDRPRIPEWGEMEAQMQLALSDAIAGTRTPKEALDWLHEEYVKLLK
jgi:multiple sugar transport system substrate-binding protein